MTRISLDELPDPTDTSFGNGLPHDDKACGNYHFMVQDIKSNEGEFWPTEDGKEPREKGVAVTLQVLAPFEYAGRTAFLDLPRSGPAGGVKKTLRFCLATGILTTADLEAAKKARQEGGNGDVDPDFSLAFGKTFCGTWEKNEYTPKGSNEKKVTYRIGGEFLSDTDPKTDDWPKDMTYVSGGGSGSDDNPF